MSGSPSTNRARVAFTVTVSGDPRFVDTVRTLTLKAAEADGCAGDDAARLAEAVERVMTALLGDVRAALDRGAMDLSFEPRGETFCVEIRVPAGTVAATGGTLERSLAATGELDLLRTLAPQPEFGEAGAHQYCRLACTHAPGPS